MGYLTEEQKKDGSGMGDTVAVGESARVVLTEYAPFQTKKGKTMPKHLGFDNNTGARYEFTGYAFHEAVKELSDSITPNVTVLDVQCLDNSTQWPDYSLIVSTDAVNAEYAAATAKPVESDLDKPITVEDVPF